MKQRVFRGKTIYECQCGRDYTLTEWKGLLLQGTTFAKGYQTITRLCPCGQSIKVWVSTEGKFEGVEEPVNKIESQKYEYEVVIDGMEVVTYATNASIVLEVFERFIKGSKKCSIVRKRKVY